MRPLPIEKLSCRFNLGFYADKYSEVLLRSTKTGVACRVAAAACMGMGPTQPTE